jgi:DNA-binding response OmpR family regulator
MKRSVLVIEDDQDIAESLRYSLEMENFEARVALTGEEGLIAALDQNHSPNVILLDLLLPGINGVEICRRLRREQHTLLTPIIMLTARTSPEDIARGLDAGADDYMTKPFSVREVLTRIDALIRRVEEQAALTYDDGQISFDFRSMLVLCRGVATRLTNVEFVLLSELAAHPGTLATREQLINRLWGAGCYGDARSLDTSIQALRTVLKSCGEVIETEAGVGYRFVGAPRATIVPEQDK